MAFGPSTATVSEGGLGAVLLIFDGAVCAGQPGAAVARQQQRSAAAAAQPAWAGAPAHRAATAYNFAVWAHMHMRGYPMLNE